VTTSSFVQQVGCGHDAAQRARGEAPLTGLFDAGSFHETLPGWARTVVGSLITSCPNGADVLVSLFGVGAGGSWAGAWWASRLVLLGLFSSSIALGLFSCYHP
jgi:hypothetical protein